MKIQLAHDFICPWCWVGLFQAKRLAHEEGVEIEWMGYELFPRELEWPSPSFAPEPPKNKPLTPSRFDLMLAAEGIDLPQVDRPFHMRTFRAHQALEFAKAHGVGFQFAEVLYRALWEEGRNINELSELKRLAQPFHFDEKAYVEAIEEDQFQNQIVGFDDAAYAKGVYNVPTFFIGGERYAEQPYAVLKHAVKEAKEFGDVSAYRHLQFPPSPEDRPYTFIDMVTTIDGKSVSGDTDDDVLDLGSKIDHQVMRRIEKSADAVLLGAGTLRATPSSWTPHTKFRIVVTRSGKLDYDHAFLKGPGAFVATGGSAPVKPHDGVGLLRAGGERLDVKLLLHRLRGMGIQRLLVLGGSETNAELLRHGLVDELFLTLAPKIKLGRGVNTFAGGEPLPRGELQNYDLIEHHKVGSELFLRYRRASHR